MKMLGWRDMVSKLGVRCVIEVKSGWRVAGELGKRRFSRMETETLISSCRFRAVWGARNLWNLWEAER